MNTSSVDPNQETECLAIKHAHSTFTLHHLVVTIIVLSVFIITKSYYNQLRRRLATCSVFIVGGGPTGMTSALVASRNKHVKTVVIFEELDRASLLAKDYQVAFNNKSQELLASLGIDFDSLEGVKQDGIFHTRIGVYVEHVLSMIEKTSAVVPVTVKCGVKFTKENVVEIEKLAGRKLVIAADGQSGHSARLLGLSDEFHNTSFGVYGAVASLELNDQRPEPRAERRVHGLHFDLSAYGIEQEFDELPSYSAFSLKLFGTSRQRHLSLALSTADNTLVKRMRLVLDRSMMRNIFTACYNQCKWSDETDITDTWAIRHLTFSPRLYDIKLFQRIETVAYFTEPNMYVLVEGEAARCTNFNTGMDVNLVIAGLLPLRTVIKRVACAFTELDITAAIAITNRHAHALCKRYVKSGLAQDMLKSAGDKERI